MSQYTGCKPNNVLIGLKHLGTHGHVNVLIVAGQCMAVTRVKNLWQCASCLAPSATVSLEGVWSIATGNLLPLIESSSATFEGLCRYHLNFDKSTINMSSKVKEGAHSVVGSSPVTHHRCQATPIEVRCLSLLLPTLCACLTPSQPCIPSCTLAKCALLL